MAGLLTYPGFMKPSHNQKRHSGRYFIKPSSRETRDRASQQRVLLRIQTAFPFHYNEKYFIVTPKQNKDKLFFKMKPYPVLTDINNY
jgi:hypothetical protein